MRKSVAKRKPTFLERQRREELIDTVLMSALTLGIGAFLAMCLAGPSLFTGA